MGDVNKKYNIFENNMNVGTSLMLMLYLSGTLGYRGYTIWIDKLILDPGSITGIFLKVLSFLFSPILSRILTNLAEISLKQEGRGFKIIIFLFLLLGFCFTLAMLIKG